MRMKQNTEFKEKIARVFDESAKDFDTIGTPFFKYFGESLAYKVELDFNMKILDIGCGKGASLIPIAKKLGRSGEITGVDISQKMIEETNAIIKEEKLSNANAQFMDAEDLQFPDKYFDIVICSFGLFFFPDIQKAMDEIKRVLKNNGKFIFATWNDKYRMSWLSSKLEKYLPGAFENESTGSDEIEKNDFYNIPGIKKILALNNFKSEAIYTEYVECFSKDENELLDKWWNTGFRLFLEELSEDEFEAYKKDVKEHLQTLKEDGKIKYIMSSYFVFATKINTKKK